MNEYFIDTNIFMYAAGKPHEFKEPCVAILSRVQKSSRKFYTDTTTSIFQIREQTWL
jgi:predicted nucleic acid-binding protein